MPISPPPPLKAGLFGRTIGGPQKPPGAAKPPAATGPKGVRVEHRIGVAAPAEAIWQVIADLPRWSTWPWPCPARPSGRSSRWSWTGCPTTSCTGGW